MYTWEVTETTKRIKIVEAETREEAFRAADEKFVANDVSICTEARIFWAKYFQLVPSAE